VLYDTNSEPLSSPDPFRGGRVGRSGERRRRAADGYEAGPTAAGSPLGGPPAVRRSGTGIFASARLSNTRSGTGGLNATVPRGYAGEFVYYRTVSPAASKRKRGDSRPESAASAMSSRRGQARVLVASVAKAMKTPLADVKGPSRLRTLSRVRAVAGYLGRAVAGVPIARVAEEVGRDPSTLWRDVQWLEGEMKRDRKLRAEISRLASAFAARGKTRR
jgi:hypothetical protein